MTRDDIIRLARVVIPESAAFELKGHYEIERFAALVAAHEREACLKAFRDLQNGRDDPINGDDWDQGWSAGWHSGVFDCKDVIRAREENP